jgi:hypothetical protein
MGSRERKRNKITRRKQTKKHQVCRASCAKFGHRESDKHSGTVSGENDMIAGFLFFFFGFTKTWA